jgi:hypothetical protein
MKRYEEVEVCLHAFLNSALHEGEKLASCPDPLFREKNHRYQLVGREELKRVKMYLIMPRANKADGQ